ncbi:hypothetical protein N8T08_002621 [Aspergillus melleus]|uniref:Uncharacterized protein n=1 Tax=Aspergillus melleus TaxID=138277 RepID=A0ACC3ALY9_9EURO|nr:hypothetical protein N8T08_002621 [Aspergillus melleus]
MAEAFTHDLVSRMESAFQITDEAKVELTMPVMPEKGEEKDENNMEWEQQASPRENVFKRRLRALTGSSPKTPSSGLGSDRRRASLGASSLSAGSDSLTGRDANLMVGPPKRPGIEGKRSFTSPSVPLKLKYISPTDYMLVDIDPPEARPALKAPEPGLLPKMKDAAQQAMGKKKSDGSKPSKKYHQTALHINSGDVKTSEATNKKQELIEYARNVTGTEVRFRDLNNPNAKQRKDDVRVWDTVNLRCIGCRGDCPVCGGACCIYGDAIRTIDNESAGAEKVGKAKRILEAIESLSPKIMDADTYQLCSQPGGCGRYVCPSCCGVCPNEICRDVQCKDCKEDPWGPCDWHD